MSILSSLSLNLTVANSFLIPLAKCETSTVTYKSAILKAINTSFLLIRRNINSRYLNCIIDSNVDRSVREGSIVGTLSCVVG